ncbi:LysR family transcriptional regulator [Geotalea uraniireducens]|uniref:Transcriptional regulator, LysR family n=1 Tax=Geotalea uraniireducens (strain Rf4) TaxID=351605 RepID=A5GCN9_GEOUR|nr:LysR family transcriptional regulator [Geotalea uraniireducens]ABQ24658.1 transcriptional regulator, LysR family [Geotalea uraniireducens Rf4]
MESIYLKTLIEAVKTGSLSKAAENLCVSPSAASRRIKFLEDQYGYPLLDRSGPVLKPTQAGSLVFDKAKKLLEIEQELLHGLTEMGNKPRISFCCTPAFGIAYLSSVLKEFMMHNADLNNLKFFFDMPDKVVKGLKEHLFDLAVIEHCACLDLKEVLTFPLPDDEMIFVSAPSLGIESAVADLDILVQQRLYSRNEGCCSKIFLDSNMQNVGRDSQEFKQIIIYDDLHLIIQAVLDGEGIAFISRSVVDKYLDNGSLRVHRVEGFRHNRNRTLVVPHAKQIDTNLMNFIGCIFSAFSLTLPELETTISQPPPPAIF